MEQNLELAKIRETIARRKPWLILPFWGIVFLIVSVAFLLPDLYRSSATIMIENPQIPQNLVPSTVTSYADQRIQGITQEVTSRTKVLALVDKFNLLPEKRDKLTAEDLVDKIKKRINVETIDAEIKKETQTKPAVITIAFKLSYDDEDPKKAQSVANEIANYFMEKNHEERAKHARNATQFLEEQLRQAKARLDDLETKLGAYREAHLEELPEFSTLNMQKLEKMGTEISNINMQIRSMEEQRSIIKTRLALLDPFGGAGEKVLSVPERLQQAQLEYAAIASRYSEKHPMMQAKKQEIALLKSKSGVDPGRTAELREKLTQAETELSDLKSRYTEKHPAVKGKMQEIERLRTELKSLQAKGVQPAIARNESATNPAYIALKTDLEKSDVSLSALKAEKARLEEQVKSVYEKLHNMPQVSTDYNQMTNDYQNAKTALADIQQKYSAAKLAQGMEDEQLGETFQVIEPAFFPEKPVKPNRLAIVLIGIVLGMGFSVGAASLVEFSDTRVHDPATVEEIAGVPVFAAIPKMLTKEDIKRGRRNRLLLGTGTVGGIAVAVILFHFFVMDLYVFYAKLMRVIERLT
jgi:succinoglycan biosynthesis transport protein ExoP